MGHYCAHDVTSIWGTFVDDHGAVELVDLDDDRVTGVARPLRDDDRKDFAAHAACPPDRLFR